MSCELTPWHTLAVALQSALVTGFIYSYSTYANALQEVFHFSQSEKDTIGIAPVMCNLITFTNGLIMDRTSVWSCCLLGGCIMGGSYGMMALIAFKHITVSSPAGVFFLLGFIGNYGASFMVAATFSVLAKNFRELRPQVVSIGKSWAGVSSGVGTAIFCGLCSSGDKDPERLNFLFFVAAITFAVPIAVSPVLRPLEQHRSSRQSASPLLIPQEWRIPMAYGLSAFLIILTLASTFFEDSPAISVILVLALLTPFTLLLPGRVDTGVRGVELSEVDFSFQSSRSEGRAREEASAAPVSPWEGGPRSMMRRPEAALLWISTLLIQSGGLFLTTNLGSIVSSRNGAAVSAATATTIFSCTQAFSRLVSGNLSGILLTKSMPRTWYFPFLMMIMAVGHLLLCLPGDLMLCLGTAVAGFAFGSVYPLLVLTVAELFGQTRVASNYMVFDGTPGAIGSLLVAKYMAQTVYEAHADSKGNCQGDVCFQLSHLLLAGLELVGLCFGVLLARRSREVYRAISRVDVALQS